MRDDDEAIVRIIELSDHLRHITKRIHIQSTIHLIQENIFRIKKFELQHLYLASLPSWETDIYISPEKFVIDAKLIHERDDMFFELNKGEILTRLSVVDRSQELKELHAFDLGYRLKCDKYPQLRSLMRIHLENIDPLFRARNS